MLGADILLNFNVYASGKSTDTVIKAKPGKQIKFDLTTFKEVSVPGGTTFPSSTGSGQSCTNVVLEAHMKIYFDKLGTSGTDFTIKEIVVDTVYGDASDQYLMKTSVTYLQWSANGNAPATHKYTGSPGYLKGSPILFAHQEQQVVSINGKATPINLH